MRTDPTTDYFVYYYYYYYYTVSQKIFTPVTL